MADGRAAELASEQYRFSARFVDMVVLIPALWLVMRSVFLAAESGIFGDPVTATGLALGVPCERSPLLSTSGLAGLMVLVFYEPLMVALWGATLGKLAMGIRVVRFADGARASMGQSWLRTALPAAAGVLTLGAGWLVVMFVLGLSVTPRRQRRGWHDTLAGTLVVTKASAVSLREVGAAPGGSASGCEGVSGSAVGLRARSKAKLLDGLAVVPLAAACGFVVESARLNH